MAKNIILKNLFSISLAEFANKGITFILTAYLARILGTAGYGMLSNVNAILLYALLVVNLGFDIIGMRDIAKVQNNDERSYFVNNIVTLKLALAVVTFTLLIAYIVIFNNPLLVKTALLFGGFQLLAASFQIDWFYQGIERMEILGIRKVCISVTTLLGVLLFVHSIEDLPLYFIIMSVSMFINNGWLIVLYFKKFAKIKLTFQLNFWKTLIKESTAIAATSFLLAIMATFSILFLVHTVGEEQTGLFASAYKLVEIAILPVMLLQIAFGPRIAIAGDTLEEKRNAAKNFAKLTAFICGIITTTMFFFPKLFLHIVFGGQYTPASHILQILMCGLVFTFYGLSISNILNLWNVERKVMYAMMLAAGSNVVFNAVLVPMLGAEGAAFAYLGSNFILAISLSVLLYKEVKTLFIPIFIKFLALAGGINFVGSYIPLDNMYSQIAAVIGVVVAFVAISMMTKMLSIKEMKKIFRR